MSQARLSLLAGGLIPRSDTAIDGTDTSCLPHSGNNTQSTVASITPNVTNKIETCEPWGLTVSGGKKPYQIVLSALDSPVITNVTMGPDDDVFTFVNRADPNENLLGE